jgi:PiT family inorganic phosphate transporter
VVERLWRSGCGGVSTTHILASGAGGAIAANGSGLRLDTRSKYTDQLGADDAGVIRAVGILYWAFHCVF